jgi:hypothetical protein
MSRLPWDPAEIGTHEADLDGVADRLTRHEAGETGIPPSALTIRIRAALDEEPLPAAPWWQRLGGTGGWRVPVRLLAAAAVLVAGVISGVALGEFAGQGQNSGSGATPPAVVSPSPTPSRSPTLSPTPSRSPTLSPTPTTSPSPTLSPSPSPLPTASDDAETPEPSGSDDSSGGNRGPGGGD